MREQAEGKANKQASSPLLMYRFSTFLNHNAIKRFPPYSLAVDFDVLPASPSINLKTVEAREAGGTGPGVIGVFTFGGGGLGGCVGRGVAARNELSVLRIACGRERGGERGIWKK